MVWLARRLGVSPQYLYRLRKRGQASLDLAQAIERETDGFVQVKQLRPEGKGQQGIVDAA